MTKRFYALLLAVLVLLAVGASDAQAAPFTRGLNFSYEFAVKWWGQEPQACASIDKEVVASGSLNEDVAEATMPSLSVPPHSVNCILRFTSELAPLNEIEQSCIIMIHEVGHLLGHHHTDNPRSPMYAPGPLIDPRICKRAGWLEERGEFFRLWLLAEP
jgi:hypothetical protein